MYLLTKYIKSVLWGVAIRLSYIQDAWCLKVKSDRCSSVVRGSTGSGSVRYFVLVVITQGEVIIQGVQLNTVHAHRLYKPLITASMCGDRQQSALRHAVPRQCRTADSCSTVTDVAPPCSAPFRAK